MPADPNTRRNIRIAVIILTISCSLTAAGIWACDRAVDWVWDHGREALSEQLGPSPTVKRALAGEQRGYVGLWRSEDGSELSIASDGSFACRLGNAGMVDSYVTGISSTGIGILRQPFHLDVQVPPHHVGDHDEMTVDGHVMVRDTTAGL